MQTNIKQSFCIKVHFKKLFSYYTNLKNNVGLLTVRPSCSSSCDISRENFLPFESMVEIRRNEAKKSIVVEIQKEENLTSLQSICSQFGTVKNMFEYKPSLNLKKHMCIVEFEEESSLKEIISEAQKGGENGSIYFPFLKIDNNKLYPQPLDTQPHQSLPVKLSKEQSKDEIITHMTHNCKNISEQIQYFYNTQKMTEVGWRLRFLTCRKIEWVLPRILSHIQVLPFGSSVNTFGNHDSDLDMIVDFTKESKEKKAKDFPLIIQPGKESNASRYCIQRNIELFADLMSFYMPGFSQIMKILHAKVPIIKCNELFTGLECDITFSNKSGYYMSEVLYIYGCCDPRVRPLVFCLRWWAKEKHLTKKMQPGRWFSNFTTTLLVLFFLMNTKHPVIPPLKFLEEIASEPVTSEWVTYERDVTRIPLTSNTDSLEVLLSEFFSFYSTFNFKKAAISIVTGNAFPKPTSSALYIQNPIERELNVSRNINLEELEMFKLECSKARCTFLEMQKSSVCTEEKDSYENVFGLVSLVGKRSHDGLGSESDGKSHNKESLVDTKLLFDDSSFSANKETKLKQTYADEKLNRMKRKDIQKLSTPPKKGKSKRRFPPFMFS